jgi:hypothetical protein
VQIPAKQRRLKGTRIKKPPDLAALVRAGHPFRFGKVAPGATQGQIGNHGLPAVRPWSYVFNMEGYAGGGLK